MGETTLPVDEMSAMRLTWPGDFLAWAACGALLAVALTRFDRLIVLFLPAMALAAVLLLTTRSGPAWWGLVSGSAVVPAWIAWTDRCSPDSCTDTADLKGLVYYASPWPFVVVAVMVIVLGLVGYALTPVVMRALRRP